MEHYLPIVLHASVGLNAAIGPCNCVLGGLKLTSQCFSEKGLKPPALQDEPGWAVVFS